MKRESTLWEMRSPSGKKKCNGAELSPAKAELAGVAAEKAASPKSHKKKARASEATAASPATGSAKAGTSAAAAAVRPAAGKVVTVCEGSRRPPVSVKEVDQHHHCVLSATLARFVAEKSGAVLVNLDSHDDLGCPPPPKIGINAATVAPLLAAGDAGALAAFDIGTWILPLVAHGAISTVIWVTAWARVPTNCEFDCTVLVEPGGALRVTGEAVPPVWRSLWSGDYVAPGPRLKLPTAQQRQPQGAPGERVRMRFRGGHWCVRQLLASVTRLACRLPGAHCCAQLCCPRVNWAAA